MKELKLIALESIAIKQIERIKINWNDKIWHKLSKLILEESFFYLILKESIAIKQIDRIWMRHKCFILKLNFNLVKKKKRRVFSFFLIYKS